MKRYNYFSAFFLSFFSGKFYRDVYLNWKGTGLLFLLLLVSISSLPKVYDIGEYVHYFVNQLQYIDYMDQVPELFINKGVLSTADNKVYQIKDAKNNKNFAIINPHISVVNMNKQADIVFFLTSDKLYLREPSKPIRVVPLKYLPNVHINKKFLRLWLQKLQKFFTIFIFPIVVVFLFEHWLLYDLMYSILCMLLSKAMRLRVDYEQALRLTTFSITPILIASTTISLFTSQFDRYLYFWFIPAVFFIILSLFHIKGVAK